jgi:hypothetical protein
VAVHSLLSPEFVPCWVFEVDASASIADDLGFGDFAIDAVGTLFVAIASTLDFAKSLRSA